MVDIAATQPGIIQTETDRMLGELVRVVDVRLLTVLDTVEPEAATSAPSTTSAAADS
jgi:hypothetical protein